MKFMTNQVTMIFETNEKANKTKQLAEFIQYGSAKFVLPFIDEKLTVVIKDVKESKKTLDEVRMIAGEIARELSKRKINEALINEQELSETFSNLDKGEVVTAFTEGWHLGTYTFITYKSKATPFATILKFVNE